jgi:hypothetical protein
MLNTLWGLGLRRLSASELRLQKQAERVLQAEQDVVPSSPCISVCRMSQTTGLCEGCFRTLDEITNWGRRSADAKRDVWQLIAQRLRARAGTQ